ncbi:hypothetical protein V7S43_005642 [Phytophthora oleae]|uniref:RxLR effector protein n=1 Tax=Phytophthora oleae TaxID=2107226 RepID=A0ABD3FU87_9STRA
MRACFALFLVVTTLVAVASGSSVNLRASQKIQSSDVVQDQTSGRELRGDLKTDEAGPDDEERLNLDFVKKLASKIKGDPLKSFAKKQANYVYSTRIFDDLLAKKFDPDTLFVKLKLNIPHNQANRYGVTTGKYRLFVNFRSSYVEKFPTWTSKLA